MRKEIKFDYGDRINIIGDTNNSDNRIREFRVVKITDVIYHGEPDNHIYRLDENSDYFSDRQKDYIIRYKNFIKWLKDNEGKQFIALIHENDIEDSRFDLPQFNVYDQFSLTHYGDHPVNHYFLTDYRLIELPKFDNIKTEKEWLKSLIVSFSYYILSNIDYQGKYPL